jgi:hypothetical protein
MNPMIQRKTQTLRIVIVLSMACFGVLPKAQAVVPPPDGGYPNFTTAEGTKALQNLTTGAANTAVGWYSLFSAGAANNNTGVGAGALALTTTGADDNTAVGSVAMFLNTVGHDNVAIGTAALLYNVNGNWNNAIGAFALHDNIDGFNNNALGQAALFKNIHGTDNTAIGDSALLNNDITGNGFGGFNTAVGSGALFSNTDGEDNTAMGFQALYSNTISINNTAIGIQALYNSTGSGNTALGDFAGFALTTGSNNVHIGNQGFDSDDNTIRIGAGQTATFIAGIEGTIVAGTTVVIDVNGQLGVAASSERFKTEIKPMDKASEAILALKPVTFHYKKNLDPDGTPQFGLVAEQVEKVNPDLVARDDEGKPYTVRYDAVNAMLLNEFLKEHKKVEKLEATVAELAEQLQKISAQMEMGSSVVKVADK